MQKKEQKSVIKYMGKQRIKYICSVVWKNMQKKEKKVSDTIHGETDVSSP